MRVRVVFGLKNDGDNSATATIVNALVGRDNVVSLRWCGHNGEDLDSVPQPKRGDQRRFRGGRKRDPRLVASAQGAPVAKRAYYVRYFALPVAVPTSGDAVPAPVMRYRRRGTCRVRVRSFASKGLSI